MKTIERQSIFFGGRKGVVRSALVAVFAVGLFLVSFAIDSGAQQITGAIRGTVKDEQGAAIPAAAVRATNVETGLSRSATTDSEGSYFIQYLPVGTYNVEVEQAGFKKFVQQNLAVALDQTQALSITLAVGAETQTVTVTETPALIDTNSATLARTVQPAEIIGLPLVNRNAYAELSLTPGVQSNSASPATNPSGTPNYVIGVPSTQVVVNGGIDGGVPMVSFYLDGGSNMTGIRNYGNPLPNPDALEEFRVETSNFSAQYGRMSSAVVNTVTRSGTNQFHGSLFEFVRNTDLNATPWNATLNPPYHRNQFGGTVGGPIKRDKAFFFFSYAGLRQTVGQFLSGGVVPTALERQGDFTQSKVIPNLPGTKTKVDGTNGSPNCQVPTVGCVPSALLDPTAANIIGKYIPLPNSANNAWTGFFTGPTNQNEYLGKYDQVLGTKDHLSATYFYLKSTQNANGSTTTNLLWDINQSFSTQQNVNISDVHTFSPTTANQTWIGFTRVAGGRVNLPATSLGDLGSNFTIQGPKALPQLTVSGYFGVGGALAGPVTTTDFYSLRDLVTMTKGKHSLNFGGELALDKNMIVGNLYNFGVFTFQTSAPTTTGNALADFVTGQVNTMEQDTPYHGLLSDWHTALFIEDDYRLTPRLMANLGLRWDIDVPPVESSNLTASFVPNVQSTVVPSAPLGMLFPGDKGIPRGIADLRWHHISPRVGLAWDPFGDGKTAVRAAGGIFYGSVSGNEWNQPANAQPFAIRQTFNSIVSFTNVYGNPASFPNGDPFPYTYTPSNPRFLPAASIESISKDAQWPLVYQINSSVQQQLPGQFTATLAYVGTLSHDLPIMIDDNYAPYAPGASTSQTSINARRPYDPGVLGQNIFLTTNQTASYNSMQFSVQRRLTHNLMLNGFYVWSHSFQSSNESAVGIAYAQDFANLWEERGPTDNDRRSMASISGIWNIDYYRGGNFFMKQLANGWTISSIATLNSGAPVNIVTGSNKNFDSANNSRPNLVAGQNAFLNSHRKRATAAAEWFNINAFTANGPGLGIGPGGADGNTPRDYLRAPGYRDIDLGVFRNISFERFTLQLRGEATNAFNMVSLNAPTANLASTLNGKITAAASPRLIQIGARFTF
ncbi:carboxypeptidase regulatory-like domain-containing protein [Alloacidobacterium dinghuense]|uniref:Carboxypeptidase regulatory-like domain-containing protein n=1 Tax=Alloacidobacterium dinghuense TaxID=2763107 RepID=A0A7G8BP47_9BACT|nr:carboxypeptidase-like regulatory domain-containing protein [Alloacidobacterium dinghuense]QNI34317.1 carboxypeptidase regulatory-like domain-containing protein [Alloacidobacterium dinghuense]